MEPGSQLAHCAMSRVDAARLSSLIGTRCLFTKLSQQLIRSRRHGLFPREHRQAIIGKSIRVLLTGFKHGS